MEGERGTACRERLRPDGRSRRLQGGGSCRRRPGLRAGALPRDRVSRLQGGRLRQEPRGGRSLPRSAVSREQRQSCRWFSRPVPPNQADGREGRGRGVQCRRDPLTAGGRPPETLRPGKRPFMRAVSGGGRAGAWQTSASARPPPLRRRKAAAKRHVRHGNAPFGSGRELPAPAGERGGRSGQALLHRVPDGRTEA